MFELYDSCCEVYSGNVSGSVVDEVKEYETRPRHMY
jgi:hypothetical protein